MIIILTKVKKLSIATAHLTMYDRRNDFRPLGIYGFFIRIAIIVVTFGYCMYNTSDDVQCVIRRKKDTKKLCLLVLIVVDKDCLRQYSYQQVTSNNRQDRRSNRRIFIGPTVNKYR